MEEGQHYNLMNFQDVVFCWNDGQFKVCLGPDKHVPIDDGFLFTVTTNDLKRNCLSLNLSSPRTSGNFQINYFESYTFWRTWTRNISHQRLLTCPDHRQDRRARPSSCWKSQELKSSMLRSTFLTPFLNQPTYPNQKFKAVFKCSPRLLCDVQTSQNWHFKHETVNDALFIQSLHIGLVWWLEFIWRKGVSQQQNSFIRTAILQL